MSGWMAAHQLIAPDVKVGRDVRIRAFVTLSGAEHLLARVSPSSVEFASETTPSSGPGSGVTKDMPPNATVTGIPARILTWFENKNAIKSTISRP
jgi:serine acetyltransferase